MLLNYVNFFITTFLISGFRGLVISVSLFLLTGDFFVLLIGSSPSDFILLNFVCLY